MKPDSSCKLCRLSDLADQVCQAGKGPRRAEVMIVTEQPVERFSNTWALLLSRLGEAGIDVDDCFVTSAIKCPTPDKRAPTKTEVKKCRDYLMYELDQVKPKFVLLVGGTPLQAVTGEAGIKKKRGKPIEQDNRFYFPIYSPGMALYDERNMPIFVTDLNQFAGLVKRGGPRSEPGLNFRIVESSEDLREAISDIETSRVISFDTETSGLNPFEPGSWVTSLGVSTATTQWCFPLNHTESKLYRRFNAQRRRVKKIAQAMSQAKTIVAHNGKFDSLWLGIVFGVWVYTDFDTMLAHYNIDENSWHGLDKLSARYFDAMDYDIPLAEKHGFGPLRRHCEYLALDIYYTRKLYFKLKRELKEDPGSYNIFTHVTMPVARMFVDAEAHGVYVDPQKLEEGYKFWSGEAAKYLKQLNQFVAEDINWSSPKQVAEVLFEQLGLKVLDLTNGGSPAVNESVLLRLAKQHELPAILLKYREATKNLGTFIEGWQKRCYSGFMHPTFKIHGTVTGRPSCEDPNLQQVPRDVRLRSLICAPPGWAFVDADLSQAELRIAAEMSGDPELMRMYQTGGDVHTLTVQRIFGIMNPTKEERKKGKAINFGFLYGMGWRKFKDYARDNYGVEFSDAECKKIRKYFFQLYAGLVSWHERQRRFVRRNGYVRSLLGRKRRLPAAMSGEDDSQVHAAQRRAINSPVQSFASDLNLAAAAQLHNSLPREYFRVVGTIHDAVVMLVREDKLTEVLPKIKAAMEHPQVLDKLDVKLRVPVVSEIEVGPWGAGREWRALEREPAHRVGDTIALGKKLAEIIDITDNTTHVLMR